MRLSYSGSIRIGFLEWIRRGSPFDIAITLVLSALMEGCGINLSPLCLWGISCIHVSFPGLSAAADAYVQPTFTTNRVAGLAPNRNARLQSGQIKSLRLLRIFPDASCFNPWRGSRDRAFGGCRTNLDMWGTADRTESNRTEFYVMYKTGMRIEKVVESQGWVSVYQVVGIIYVAICVYNGFLSRYVGILASPGFSSIWPDFGRPAA